MFTGLVEEIGEITNISRKPHGLGLTVKGDSIMKKIQIGDSIAVNGICLTVTSFTANTFTADVMFESIERTGLKHAKTGEKVNLEKSLTLMDFLGGHLVMGDVDCEAVISSIRPKGIAKVYEFQFEGEQKRYLKYIVEKGRITIDGASLTVIDTDDKKGTFSVSLIPHTQDSIILGSKKTGDTVNIETDLFGKYVEKIIKFDNEENTAKSNLTMEFLRKNGF